MSVQVLTSDPCAADACADSLTVFPARSTAVLLSLDDVARFGDGSRELFVKSSCYSAITVAVGDCGPAISWIFSSEPKSISFSVVYRESEEDQVENSKVVVVLDV